MLDNCIDWSMCYVSQIIGWNHVEEGEGGDD